LVVVGVRRREDQPSWVKWWQVGKTTVVNMTFHGISYKREAQQGNDVKLPHGR
jgi:hypothetical protein